MYSYFVRILLDILYTGIYVLTFLYAIFFLFVLIIKI